MKAKVIFYYSRTPVGGIESMTTLPVLPSRWNEKKKRGDENRSKDRASSTSMKNPEGVLN